ncbi:MAG: hypothetical protein ACJAS1_003920 [Oleiphilaceae bacterium]|jgi:hypothetical protein
MRIVFRGDSGYFAGELLEWLDAKGHGYLIKVKVKGLVVLMDQQSWRPISNCPDWQQSVEVKGARSAPARKFMEGLVESYPSSKRRAQ